MRQTKNPPFRPFPSHLSFHPVFPSRVPHLKPRSTAVALIAFSSFVLPIPPLPVMATKPVWCSFCSLIAITSAIRASISCLRPISVLRSYRRWCTPWCESLVSTLQQWKGGGGLVDSNFIVHSLCALAIMQNNQSNLITISALKLEPLFFLAAQYLSAMLPLYTYICYACTSNRSTMVQWQA